MHLYHDSIFNQILHQDRIGKRLHFYPEELYINEY